MFEILTREERIRMAREMGDGHRFMALKSNARKGFPLLNIDPATLLKTLRKFRINRLVEGKQNEGVHFFTNERDRLDCDQVLQGDSLV